MTADSPRETLAALARALLDAAAGTARPLRDVLIEHPAAREHLAEALLAAEAVPAPDAPESVPSSADDRRVGPYAIQRELGRGGQAIVYAAVDTRLGRTVALKMLHADVFSSPFREQRFRAEAATTSRLDHPGICPIYEVGETDGMPWLAMRLVEGRTLAAHIADAVASRAPGHPFHLDFAGGAAKERADGSSRHLGSLLPTLRLFESIAGALHAAHRAGVVHRDVKPGNVIVQPDGSGVVLDFGLAADDSRDGATLTRTGDVFGTPAYMAPEQCRGERVDHRADVFALGGSLYEAVTGQRPFGGKTREATIKAMLVGRVPNPCRIERSLPVELGVITSKAMDPEPARRYASAEAFADDLRRVRELRPILAAPPSCWLRARRFAQRNPWLCAMALVVLASLATSGVLLQHANAQQTANRLFLMRQELAALLEQHPRMQPVAEHRDAAAAWLHSARRLVERRREAIAMRDLIRRSGVPAPADELEAEAEPLRDERDRLEAIEQSLAAGLGTPETLAALRDERPQLVQRGSALCAQLETMRRWVLPDADDQLLHDSCVRFLADLDTFADARGTLAQTAHELDSIGRASVPWDAAIADIRTSPIYRGLALRPQRELQPVRKQPGTGLWEFAHLRSGQAPAVRLDGSLTCDDATGIVLVLLPGGRCRVGAQRLDAAAERYEPKLRDSEDYLITLELDPFFMAVHETTRAQWLRLTGEDPSWAELGVYGTTLRHPVTAVGWQTVATVLARSTLTLPTEAQWEYAARAIEHEAHEQRLVCVGDTLAENLFDRTAAELAVTSIWTALPAIDGFPQTAPVGSFKPNGFGIFDMRGNVQEWCLDAEAYPTRNVLRQRTGEWVCTPGEKHAIRGLSFLNDLTLSPMTTRTLTVGGEKDRGVRAARRLDR